ncbi:MULTISPECIES: ABC transporter ATP-binding protein [Streptomyces]|uniref:ATP-binding cassette, subfamily B n=1 Tax=Streptomyces yunnanensis TaxID=156453 RepID=A0A9X8MJA5_9ACTN|nr:MULTISPECIES: ABC transporter ATP-binding protein [Streptomyces]SHK79682.1 ATP-binding cassette, subfamily B [Streptomyces yunnanensis]
MTDQEARDQAVPEEHRRLSRDLRYWWLVLRTFWGLSPLRVSALAVATVLTAAVPATGIWLTARAVQAVVDALTRVPDAMDRLTCAAAGLVAVAVAEHILTSLSQYLNSLLQLEFTAKIGERVMVKGTRMDLSAYEDPEAYDRLQRALRESGSGTAFEVFEEMMRTLTALASLVMVSWVLFSWNVWIALAILLAPLPALAAHVVFSKQGYAIEYHRAQDRRRAFYYQDLTTTDSSYKEVKLYQLGPHLVGRYRSLVQEFFRVDRALARRRHGWSAALGLVSVGCSAGALVFALRSTADNGRIGELAGYLQALGAVHAAATGLLLGVATLYQNTLFTGNLFDYLTLPDGRITGGTRPFPRRLTHGIEFQDVTFRYPGTTTTALDRFSCFIPADTCCAIVGANGAGKSTIVKLLSRLYEPTSGRILVDGVPLEEYDTDDLQRNIGVVFQDFIRYEMPVRHNIGFGRLEHLDDDARLRTAAGSSGAAEFIDRLADTYDTTLGRHFEGGHQLSGGQWQKIALARAFLRDAPIAILDEPTAAIDAEAEADIFGRLRTICSRATSLVISHRFSTVRIADKILVVEGGALIEEGTHEELLARGGTYAHLFRLQADAYLPGASA